MRSTSSPRAVNMMIGSCERLRSSRHSDRPSSPGSIRSSTSRSTCERSRIRRISRPSATVVVRKSCFSKYCASSPRISRSSSTITTCGRSFIVPRGAEDTCTERQPAAQLVPCCSPRRQRRCGGEVVTNCQSPAGLMLSQSAPRSARSGPEWKRSVASGSVASCASCRASTASRAVHSCGAASRAKPR